MKTFLKIVLILLCLMTTDVSAARKKAPPKKKNEVVELDPEAKKAKIEMEQMTKYECGHSRPLRVASGMIGNAPFAWEEYANSNRTKYQSFGLGLKIIDRLSKSLNFYYESTGFATYEEAVKALQAGQVDVLFSVYYRPLGLGTQQIYPGYFTNPFMTYVKKGSDAAEKLNNIQNFHDLEGWRGIVREEEKIYPLIRQRMKDLNLKEVLSAAKVFQMLMEGEADYLIGSPYAIEAELRRQKLQDDIIPVGKVLDQASLFFAFSKNSKCGQMAKDFSKELTENPISKDEIDVIVRQLIDDWGNRFREEKGIMEKEEVPKKDESKEDEEIPE